MSGSNLGGLPPLDIPETRRTPPGPLLGQAGDQELDRGSDPTLLRTVDDPVVAIRHEPTAIYVSEKVVEYEDSRCVVA